MSTAHKSESFAYAVLKYVASMRKNPISLAMLLTVYVVSSFALFLYQRQARETAQLQIEIQKQERLLAALREDRGSLGFTARPIGTGYLDLFKNPSFRETTTSENRDKLEAVLRLNSFARYAIYSGDFEKARDTLNQSLKTLPTLEAQYDLGLLAY